MSQEQPELEIHIWEMAGFKVTTYMVLKMEDNMDSISNSYSREKGAEKEVESAIRKERIRKGESEKTRTFRVCSFRPVTRQRYALSEVFEF